MAKPPFPRQPTDAWRGGFAVTSPRPTLTVAARAGTVLLGGQELYLWRPGAAQCQKCEPPSDVGDVLAVAVDGSRPARLALAGLDSIVIMNGSVIQTMRLPAEHAEPSEIAWGPPVGDGPRSGPVLYVLFDESVLGFPSDGGPPLELPLTGVRAIAADDAGGFAVACLDDDESELVVYVYKGKNQWRYRRMPAPPFVSDVSLRIAAAAAAVSFGLGSVWVSRGLDEPFVEVPELKGGGAIAFEGGGEQAALFGTVRDGAMQAILRVDAQGGVVRIGALEGGEGPESADRPVCALAWDETRKTLWAAAGAAGVLVCTAPGAPPVTSAPS